MMIDGSDLNLLLAKNTELIMYKQASHKSSLAEEVSNDLGINSKFGYETSRY